MVVGETRMATPSQVEGSGDKGDMAVQTVDRQSNPTPSASNPSKPNKPKPTRSKHKRGSSSTNPRNSGPQALHSTSSAASTSSEVDAELAATPLPQHQEKYAMARHLSPFWRTPKGYAVIALVVFVIIGAIVGAAVGGSIANREAQKVDEREAAASSAAAESSASLAAALATRSDSGDTTSFTVEQRAFDSPYTYATTANTKYHAPRQTQLPAETTVVIRGRKPPARGPTN